ncbi:CLUMA_CG001744, isoform A [Clunio marinus]|uniref:CLUMA_CG001744, isoform A n=1 Tax=Clunio marinus TaxID=568069 RepID=A0A1J1HNB1_9DIPT|nr:CLUMA_CG001744, isoform A [Clunio marinus]
MLEKYKWGNEKKDARCNREKPPCKYYHPPQHLKDQLLINGRNHLALKNALMQQMGMPPNGQPIITNQMQPMAPNAYIAGVPASNHYNPYFAPGQLVPTILGPDPSTVSQASVSPQMTQCVPQPVPMPQQQKHPQHSDRIETYPGMVPYKRPAGDKSSIPIYQPNTTNYQQIMHMQQPFVPVSCEYPASVKTSELCFYQFAHKTVISLISRS